MGLGKTLEGKLTKKGFLSICFIVLSTVLVMGLILSNPASPAALVRTPQSLLPSKATLGKGTTRRTSFVSPELFFPFFFLFVSSLPEPFGKAVGR